MKKSTKNAIKALSFSLIATTLVGCSNGKKIDQETYIEPIYEEKAVFIETYQDKHMDVLVGDAKKMYEIPPSLVKKVDAIKQNDLIVIEYSLDNELKKSIKDIRLVGATKKVVEKKPIEKSKEEKNKKENVLLRVYKNNQWVDEKAVAETINDQYDVKLLENYKIQGNKILFEENENYFVELEELPSDTEIKPQRWRASDELKKIGDLKELLGTNIYDPNFREAAFVFTAQNNVMQQNIVVREEDGHLMRYTMVFPTSEAQPTIEPALWAMMESLEYR